ncbi:MAG: MFS transporter [Anaerolineales bacterium]
MTTTKPMETSSGPLQDIRWFDYITINANWFALTTRSQVLTPLVVPLLVQQFVGEGSKGSYVGMMRLWALMAALLFQALMGVLSDRTRSRWGRRRPFILLGTVGEVVVFTLIGLVAGLEGMTGYWLLFGLFILSMLTSNTSHAATNALIPDLVPDQKKGIFSGIKAALELPIPLIFVSFVIGRIIANGNLVLALAVLSLVMVVAMGITMFVRERRLASEPEPVDWRSLGRLVLMTITFTIIILAAGAGVRALTQWAQPLGRTAALAVVGVAGVLGMGLAVIAGVWLSTRIAMGQLAERSHSFRWWVVNRLAFLVGANNMAAFMVFFLQEKFPAFSQARAAGPAATILMFVGIFILVTALPGGWLADRVGKKRVILASGLIASAGTFVVVFSPSLNPIYLGGSIIGAGVGLFYAASWALGTQMVPSQRAGQLLGIQNLAGAGAGAVGAYIGGPIADEMSYTLLIGLYGLLMLLSVIALLGVEDTGAEGGHAVPAA